MTSLPSIFVSHGGPTMAVVDSPARQFLQTLKENHAPPKAILMISAHWETASPATSNPAELETIHDYYGFPQELYRFQYPAHGDPALAQRVATLIAENGLGATSQTPARP